MLKVTADIFSGRPNPTWIVDGQEAQAVLRELALNREAWVAQEELGAEAGLGYRGLIIEPQSDTLTQEYGLPQSLRINTGQALAEQKGQEIAERLIPGMLDYPSITEASLDSSVQQQLLENITTPAVQVGPVTMSERELEPKREEIKAEAADCQIESVTLNLAFWNDPNVVTQNNCYNYASNRRTNTFAQPGRACGHQYDVDNITCDEVTRGALCDGARVRANCVPGGEAPRWFMALVVWPGRDYHWYRYSSEGFWGHKPGRTPARNTDDSGRVVWNPETANRGPYTNFCGYFYARSPMVVR
jgi:hypothetical protein